MQKLRWGILSSANIVREKVIDAIFASAKDSQWISIQ